LLNLSDFTCFWIGKGVTGNTNIDKELNWRWRIQS